ncbi:MAG: hypothetical protein M3448_07950 [Pseudomonadota bacterium]|nr:hypothetical protein [Pseudomonadota bacterium]
MAPSKAGVELLFLEVVAAEVEQVRDQQQPERVDGDHHQQQAGRRAKLRAELDRRLVEVRSDGVHGLV